MKHLILTRFNVSCGFGSCYKDDDWLRERVRLFYKFCLPSVEFQVNQNFTWYLFVDSSSPNWLREEFDCISARYNNVKWIFSPDQRDARDRVIASIKREDFPLLTTRLDSDDVIFPHFTKVLQQKYFGLQPLVLDFPYGYVLHLCDNKVRELRVRCNQFASHAESNFPIKTVLRCKHKKLGRYYPSRFVSTKPMWCHIIHEKNYSKKVRETEKWRSLDEFPRLLNFLRKLSGGIFNSK